MNLVPVTLAVLVALVLGYVRFAPSAPGRWHVDPLTAARPKTPNAFILRDGAGAGAGDGDRAAPQFDLAAPELAHRIDRLVMATQGARRLGGGPDAPFATYVLRSRIIGFPDYVSVRAIDLGEGRSALAVFSRSRFGRSDLGVNRRRVLGWLEKL